MKTLSSLALTWLALASLTHQGVAQSYAIAWHTFDGGGGTSTGGAFSLGGTAGQPDASTGSLSGANFSLTGGFWSHAPALDPPRLAIYRTNANRLVISWPSPSTGFVLEQTTGLAPGSWTAPAEAVIDNGTDRFILVNPAAGNRFYRLARP